MPVLGNGGDNADMAQSLRTKVPKILKLGTPNAPRAIVLVTAHWSQRHPTISSAEKPSLYYDYRGFPPETYQLKYPAPGSPEVAQLVKRAMEDEGLKPELDSRRGACATFPFRALIISLLTPLLGWDHGVFVPLLLVNPKADVPVVQVSVLASEDPAAHFAMGRALNRLRDSNIAIVGSGFASLHNLREMLSLNPRSVGQIKPKIDAWNAALGDAVMQATTKEREAKLLHWREFPHAYETHPASAAEHFMPLLVCASAAGDQVGKAYKDDYHGLDMFSYYWD
jgi:aromatic ring-opening dioxygenase catalytic subunit (LigB family)